MFPVEQAFPQHKPRRSTSSRGWAGDTGFDGHEPGYSCEAYYARNAVGATNYRIWKGKKKKRKKKEGRFLHCRIPRRQTTITACLQALSSRQSYAHIGVGNGREASSRYHCHGTFSQKAELVGVQDSNFKQSVRAFFIHFLTSNYLTSKILCVSVRECV